MKELSLILIFVMFISSNLVFAQSEETSKQIEIDSQKTKVVLATGVGETEHEAIKDAGRSAVKEAVGMFLVSETIVENEELIKDEVLSVSDGFVSKFRTISKREDEDGLVEVKATITVVIGKVASKLRGMNISMKDVGSDEFVAVELDKFSSIKEYKKMFEEVIVKPLIYDDTYELTLTDFKPLDDEDYTLSQSLMYAEPNQQKERQLIEEGELIPYSISFNLSLSDGYIRKVESLLKSFSKLIIDTPLYDAGTGHYNNNNYNIGSNEEFLNQAFFTKDFIKDNPNYKNLKQHLLVSSAKKPWRLNDNRIFKKGQKI